jgi:hypothetical protein
MRTSATNELSRVATCLDCRDIGLFQPALPLQQIRAFPLLLLGLRRKQVARLALGVLLAASGQTRSAAND